MAALATEPSEEIPFCPWGSGLRNMAALAKDAHAEKGGKFSP